MATFSHSELSNPDLLDRSFARLPSAYRTALRELLFRADGSVAAKLPPRPRGERVDDANRGRRMLQLIRDGKLDYPAAGQACVEDPGANVANVDACRRRLVRK